MALPRGLKVIVPTKAINPEWLEYWRIAHSDPSAYTLLYGGSIGNRTPNIYLD